LRFIEIEEDFMARQTRAEPVHALAELIWNSVDADASRVTVEFEFKDLALGMSKIVVYDGLCGAMCRPNAAPSTSSSRPKPRRAAAGARGPAHCDAVIDDPVKVVGKARGIGWVRLCHPSTLRIVI
jgi:hypothetical protein